MRNFTNVFGTEVAYKPFYQTVLNVWRVARFEDGELDVVFENKGFESEKSCQKHIDKLSDNQANWMLHDALNN